MPLLRLLEAEPLIANEMPSYAGTTAKKGVLGKMGRSVGLFKGKVDGGMADEVLAVLCHGLREDVIAVRSSAAKREVRRSTVPPPTFESLPSLRELRRTHRNGLQPRALPCDATVRWMPDPFDAEMQSPTAEIGARAAGGAQGHVLEAISPLLYLEEVSSGESGGGGSGGGGGGGGAGAHQLALPPLSAHAAAKSVVAKKMLSRLDSDLRWLSDQNRTAAKPLILRGFGSFGSGATERRRKVAAELGAPDCA